MGVDAMIGRLCGAGQRGVLEVWARAETRRLATDEAGLTVLALVLGVAVVVLPLAVAVAVITGSASDTAGTTITDALAGS
ncbi:MAG: hypothetical protein DK306_002249 [Chloroflexi bacterium]|nr:MAG: hypothetical protein DK306_002249 [Chloroflexota bacterium]